MKKILLILCFLLSACSKPLHSGMVIDKQYIPAHTRYQPMVININNHIQIFPQYRHIPDKWIIQIQNGDKKDSWYVSEDYYNSVDIGDFITSEQLQKTEFMLRKWIKDWEECVDIYLKNKDSNNPEELQLANIAKEQANKIADDYNRLILKYGNMFGETLPEGIYAVIERIE